MSLHLKYNSIYGVKAKLDVVLHRGPYGIVPCVMSHHDHTTLKAVCNIGCIASCCAVSYREEAEPCAKSRSANEPASETQLHTWWQSQTCHVRCVLVAVSFPGAFAFRLNGSCPRLGTPDSPNNMLMLDISETRTYRTYNALLRDVPKHSPSHSTLGHAIQAFRSVQKPGESSRDSAMRPHKPRAQSQAALAASALEESRLPNDCYLNRVSPRRRKSPSVSHKRRP